MKRIDALQRIYKQLDSKLIITNMGAVAAELYSLGHKKNFFYLEHSMGLASSVGLGTGLHTFVLYLGPYIAQTAIHAQKC